MKISGCILGLIGLCWLLYRLFQPIVDANFGWQELPAATFQNKFKGIEDDRYEAEILKSKQLIDSIQRASKSPSISIAAMINGRMVWTYAVGFQDIERSVPADTSTVYRIGSTSKALTSLGLGKLIQQGDIHLDSSIQFYTEYFKEQPKITIRQLASHQSGIRNYQTCLCFPIWEYYRNKQFDTIEESVQEFESDELLFNPGDKFSYSSFNFTALSLAMDYITPHGFLTYMDKEVFHSLGMMRTRSDRNDKLSDKAIPYEVVKQMYRKSSEVNLSNKWAGGGFLSNPSNLVRAGNVLLETDFLDQQTIKLITSPQRLNDGTINEQNYALGWRNSTSQKYFNGARKVNVIHHGGMAMGSQALLLVYPEYNMVIAITLNKSGVQGNFELFNYVNAIANGFLNSIKENGS